MRTFLPLMLIAAVGSLLLLALYAARAAERRGVTAAAAAAPVAAKEEPMKSPTLNPLTPAEARVILHKGTEPPFTGKYTEHDAEGYYQCRHCNALLYRSADKFHSGCGWPAFDDEIAGAVRRVPDADGRRTEIVCAACDGHLGHVFLGEGFTEKDTRHCVNSISLNFVPLAEAQLGRAVFAAGCFWGVEYVFQEAPGVLATTVGYIGGTTPNPTYQQVCGKKTGHAEAVEVLYDPVRTDFERLARLFFEIHDPTQVDRQGPDVGSQYRSAIFPQDAAQGAVAERLIGLLEKKGLAVATRLEPAARFWAAEDYHQDYFRKHGAPAVCHRRVERF